MISTHETAAPHQFAGSQPLRTTLLGSASYYERSAVKPDCAEPLAVGGAVVDAVASAHPCVVGGGLGPLQCSDCTNCSGLVKVVYPNQGLGAA